MPRFDVKTVCPPLPDILDGTLEPVALVAKRRTGRRPSPPTIWRWGKKGLCKGRVRLQAVFVSGVWMTTPAAFDEFIAAQTAAALAQNDAPDDADDDALRAAGLL